MARMCDCAVGEYLVNDLHEPRNVREILLQNVYSSLHHSNQLGSQRLDARRGRVCLSHPIILNQRYHYAFLQGPSFPPNDALS